MWSLWPNEIESGLLLKGIDIHDWHRGTLRNGVLTLSSRRLLGLLDELPEASKYKTVRERDGNWPEWLQMLKTLTNETSLHRAAIFAGGENAYEPTVYLDPIERVEHFKEAVIDGEEQEQSTEQFYGELGWT